MVSISIIQSLVTNGIPGRENMVGATNYWKMIIQLRPYLFQVSLIHLELDSNSVFTRVLLRFTKCAQAHHFSVYRRYQIPMYKNG